MKHAVVFLLLAVVACTPGSSEAPVPTGTAPSIAPRAGDVFVSRLTTLCGRAFKGQVVSADPADAQMAGQNLIMHVVGCSTDETRIAFYVGDDSSRTWIITKTSAGLRLKHEHRHRDGTEDVLSQYGGDTINDGTTTRQEFPADAFSKELFLTKGNPASVDNIWAIETTGSLVAYELRRPQRFFRVEFDLKNPAAFAVAAKP